MTDNEVMEILTRCALFDADACQDCPFNGSACRAGVISEAYEFACRKRAEIERLQKQLKEGIDLSDKVFKVVKSEAIKEFADKLCGEMWDWLGNMTSDNNKLYIHSKIHSLADEITEKGGTSE